MKNNRPELRWLCVAALWASMLITGACSMAPVIHIDTDNSSLPAYHEITATPFYPQQAFQCGPAALAMVLGYYGSERSPAALTPWLFTPDARGTFPAELDAVSRKEGFISYPVHTITALLQEVAADHPVLVLQNLGTRWYTQWHFAVVVGFDLKAKHLVLRSADLERRITALDTFDVTWARGDRWARAVVPPDIAPFSAEPLTYLKAAGDLEQTGPLNAAETAYRTALARWPDQPLAAFGLGNTLLQLKRYGEASAVFARLVQQRPGMAPAWNNYAYALNGQQCGRAALAAAHCALQLAPENPDIAQSVTELTAARNDTGQCHTPACPLLP